VIVNKSSLEEWREGEFHPQGITSPLGDKIHPWASKFASRGEVKNGPLACKKTVCFFLKKYSRTEMQYVIDQMVGYVSEQDTSICMIYDGQEWCRVYVQDCD
jgi:hypothetical protein